MGKEALEKSLLFSLGFFSEGQHMKSISILESK